MSTHQGRPQAKPHPRVNLRPGPARPGAVPNREKNGLAWAITAHAIRDPCPAPALPVFRRSHLGLRHKSSVFFLGLGNCPWPSAWQRRAGNGRCYCASPLRKKEGNFLCRGSASGISGRPVNGLAGGGPPVAFKGRGLNCRGPGMKCALKKNKNWLPDFNSENTGRLDVPKSWPFMLRH